MKKVIILVFIFCITNTLFALKTVQLTVTEINKTSKYIIVIGKDSVTDNCIILLADINEHNLNATNELKINKKIEVEGRELNTKFIDSEKFYPLIIDEKRINVEWGRYKLYWVTW